MEKTFLELISENQSILFKICNVYFREKVDKEDYHQELIIQLWKAFPDFKNTAKFSTWMYRVCINAAIDILRKDKKEIKKLVFQKSTYIIYLIMGLSPLEIRKDCLN
ncbi:MAG: sigma-70 family RNA polymerase sigma factor [Saprospiraceae bacterium]|nr:sigma-70 family RNA polymerase sigma factor [Saprospiraceae bacterium]